MNTIREQLNIYEQEIDQIKEQSRIKVRIKSIIYFLINKDFCEQNIKIRNLNYNFNFVLEFVDALPNFNY